MRRTLTLFLLTVIGVPLLVYGQRDDTNFAELEHPAIVSNKKIPTKTFNSKADTFVTGPGTELMQTTFPRFTNLSMPRTIHNYGDGRLFMTVMAATVEDHEDRGSYWSFFDGSAWRLPMSRIESKRSGYGSIDVLSDGRPIVTSHYSHAKGSTVSIDESVGAGNWTIKETGYLDNERHIWSRIAIDGADNIHLVSTYETHNVFSGIRNYYVYSRSNDAGESWTHHYPFGGPPDTSGDQWKDGQVEGYAIDAWHNKVGIVAFAQGHHNFHNIYFAESEDYGATFSITNITKRGKDSPGNNAFQPTGDVAILYNQDSNAHLYWTNYPNANDTPIRHWNKVTGTTDVTAFKNIFPMDVASKNLQKQLGLSSTILKQPQAGIDTQGNLYLTFSAPRSGYEKNGLSEIYAVASHDNGATWSPPVNITDSPETANTFASLAEHVDDHLHILYLSQSPQQPSKSVMHYAFPTSQIVVPCASQGGAFTLPRENELGNIPNGPRAHSDKVRYCLAGMPNGSYLTYEVYDADTNDEIDLLLNGNKIHDIVRTPNAAWSGKRAIRLPVEFINADDENLLVFDNIDNPSQSRNWGVRNVAVTDTLFLPMQSAFGRIRGGDQAHADKVKYTFIGQPGDFTLNYYVYGIDDSNEVEIFLNGSKIHTARPTDALQWSDRRNIILGDVFINDQQHNEIRFVNRVNSDRGKEYYWGVKEVYLSACLALPQMSENYQHKKKFDRLLYCFPPHTGEIDLAFRVYDVNAGDTVRVFLNERQVFMAPATPFQKWSQLHVLELPDSLVKDEDVNFVEIEARLSAVNRKFWGIDNMFVSPCPILPSFERFGSFQNSEETIDTLRFAFTEQSGYMILHYQVYDIDSSDSLDIVLNGYKINTAMPTAAGQWSATRSLLLPFKFIKSHEVNEIRFVNKRNHEQEEQSFWGVRNLRIKNCSYPPGKDGIGYIAGGDTTHIDLACFIFPGRAGDFNLSIEAYDIDDTSETAIILNNTLIGHLAPGPQRAWSGQQTFFIADSLMMDSVSNYLVFDNTGNPPRQRYWGVRDLQITQTEDGDRTLAVAEESILPKEYALMQNYPNPFNPVTTIQYAVPKPGYIELKIFNSMGQEVAVLVNEKRVPGRYDVQWHAGDLPSGVYMYRFQAGEYIEKKKLVLLK